MLPFERLSESRSAMSAAHFLDRHGNAIETIVAASSYESGQCLLTRIDPRTHD